MQGKAAEFSIGPTDGWVKPQFFDRQAATTLVDASDDDHLLLLERQIDVSRNATFFHSIRQILTSAGVQNDATLKIDFNPSYQALKLHWAHVWRGGEPLDRLDANQVKVVQQERDIDQYLLNGEKSAVLVLDDVRIGDIIDYAYSLTGTNPVFGGHFSAAVPVQFEQPAERLFTRVLWPVQRHLYAKDHGCAVQPLVVPGKELVEYAWDLRQAPGMPLEDSLPAWYDPQPWVQLSEFKTWAEVNQWATALFTADAPGSPELASQIAAWRQIGGHEQQVLAVLQFVQEQVRYFGIEIGSSAIRPANPSVVFGRRFGDCKDKSLLFVTILRALGIQAWPVLVNATATRAIADWQPTAGAFDHCIAVVQCDGQVYWVDPTMNYQRGPLAAHYLPDYQRGLVIKPGITTLAVIPHNTGLPLTTTTEHFVLHGKTEPAELKVVSVAEGRDAEILRELFATNKRSDIEKTDTHFYSGVYPGITLTAPVDFADDQQQNRVQTTEYFSIANAWTQSDRARKYRCEFYPAGLAALLRKPVDVDRTLPLGIDHPQHQILRTEVTLPEAWPPETEEKTVSDSAFTFREARRCAGKSLVMAYEYQSLTDAVPAEQASQTVDHINEAEQLLGHALSWQ
jgi:transglutaminase-like putative cysteine protease